MFDHYFISNRSKNSEIFIFIVQNNFTRQFLLNCIFLLLKIELSNFLSLKELIVAKKKFLSYDKEATQMISREDAKCCYIEFIEKLRLLSFEILQ